MFPWLEKETMKESILAGHGHLYAISDQEKCTQENLDIIDFSQAVFDGGCKLLQYRDKISSETKISRILEEILPVAAKYDALVILNDYLRIATDFNSPVHLGAEDQSLLSEVFTKAETPNSQDKPIPHGRTIHSLEQLNHWSGKIPRPDYIGFGTIFQSEIKPNNQSNFDLIPEILSQWNHDIVLIGGIHYDNLPRLPKEKNIYYAMISGFFQKGNSLRAITNSTSALVELIIS